MEEIDFKGVGGYMRVKRLIPKGLEGTLGEE
jgi:hypothetical protein